MADLTPSHFLVIAKADAWVATRFGLQRVQYKPKPQEHTIRRLSFPLGGLTVAQCSALGALIREQGIACELRTPEQEQEAQKDYAAKERQRRTALRNAQGGAA